MKRAASLTIDRRQRGVVLLFSLIALAIMLIGAVALTRSFQVSLFSAGNLGFKRDLQNQSELAVATVMPLFRGSGPLGSETARATDRQDLNYKAVMLATDAQGIPTALTTDTGFASVGTATNDITSTDGSVTIRYLVDRLCGTSGNGALLGATQCTLGDNLTPNGTSVSNLQGAGRVGVSTTNAAAVLQTIVYRLSIRVTGPRNTQSFFQSTFVVPS